MILHLLFPIIVLVHAATCMHTIYDVTPDTFIGNKMGIMLFTSSTNAVIMQNTTFFGNMPRVSIFALTDSKLLLMGPVIIQKTISSICVAALDNSTIFADHYVELSQNDAKGLFAYRCSQKECFYTSIGNNTIVNITRNVVGALAYCDWLDELKLMNPPYQFYPPCFFQYFGTRNQQTFIILKNNTKTFQK